MKKTKLKKKKGIKGVKGRAWNEFSKYIRLRDANPDGYCTCVTCGKVGFWYDDGMNAGHYLASRNTGILWDERGVHAQCAIPCNKFPDGEVGSNYKKFMLETYGQGVIDELKHQKMNPPKYERDFYVEKEREYKEKVLRLKSEKGL